MLVPETKPNRLDSGAARRGYRSLWENSGHPCHLCCIVPWGKGGPDEPIVDSSPAVFPGDKRVVIAIEVLYITAASPTVATVGENFAL